MSVRGRQTHSGDAAVSQAAAQGAGAAEGRRRAPARTGSEARRATQGPAWMEAAFVVSPGGRPSRRLGGEEELGGDALPVSVRDFGQEILSGTAAIGRRGAGQQRLAAVKVIH